MDTFKGPIGFIGFVCLMLSLVTSSEGRLFKVLDKDNNVCGMMEVNFTLTFTAFQDGKKFRTVSYNQDFYRNFVSGDCNRNMAVHFDNAATWDLHVHFKLVPDPKYLLTRTVSFVPGRVFGQTVPSNTTQTFVNVEDATIGPVDCSYKCSVDDKSYYKKANSTSDYQGMSGTSGFSYTVLVDVTYIQVQVSHVHREKFGPVVACQTSLYYH